MSTGDLTRLDHPSFIERLRARLASDLPGHSAQLRMAPDYRRDLLNARAEGTDCTQAAVLIALTQATQLPSVLLTVRRGHLKRHAGQVSFPGGRCEPDESRLETALRESLEEVNLDPGEVDVLGELTPLYIPPTNYCVHPFVGAVRGTFDPLPQPSEVASILFAPLPFLLDDASIRTEEWTLRGRRVHVPFYAFEQYKIWGATAMMLSEFAAACSDVLRSEN